MRATSLLLPFCLFGTAYAQTPPQPPQPPLFREHTPLTLRLQTNLKALFRDRGQQKTEHPGVLTWVAGADSGRLEVKLRTRGIFRLKRCAFPPIRLDVPSHTVEGTPFAGQDKLKLATHCQGDRTFERNLLREYALYRVFNALTDTSFRVRLARVTYSDSTGADTLTRYGFLVESDIALARRVGTGVLHTTTVNDVLTDPGFMTLVAVFQYLIGNTDWSVWGLHNIALLSDTLLLHPPLAVPYDFDFSGAVGASYAVPPPQIPIQSVRERWYRGFCQPDTLVARVLERFRAAKDSIYSAVRAVPDLKDRDARDMLQYFDDFYDVIANPASAQRLFARTCRRLPQ
ncbi:MAG: hypothetical protein ABR537_10760 [Gemmatimonadales bacterium]